MFLPTTHILSWNTAEWFTQLPLRRPQQSRFLRSRQVRTHKVSPTSALLSVLAIIRIWLWKGQLFCKGLAVISPSRGPAFRFLLSGNFFLSFFPMIKVFYLNWYYNTAIIFSPNFCHIASIILKTTTVPQLFPDSRDSFLINDALLKCYHLCCHLLRQ